MERETRRRNISERSSDRLGLITGRLHSLEEEEETPPSSPSSDLPNSSSSSLHNRTQSAPASNFSFQDHPHPLFQNSIFHGNQDSTEINEAQSCAVAATNLSQTSSPTTSDNINAQETCPKSRGNIFHFTLKDVNSCVLTSENTRLFCSIMIALLVVISYANIPHHIVKSKSIISSRPLYVLLASDAMIVILRLRVANSIRRRKRVNKEEGNIKSSMKEDSRNNDDQLSEAIKVMEWGLVLYQILRAVFIDCSFYTVIVVSGFSFI